MPICLVDIGAAGGIHSRWNKFQNFYVLGFEPDDVHLILYLLMKHFAVKYCSIKQTRGINFYFPHQ